MSKSLETDACWDRIEREALVREATSETFERLYSLVRKGYRPDFESPYHGVMDQFEAAATSARKLFG
jgi:hypothetical protein